MSDNKSQEEMQQLIANIVQQEQSSQLGFFSQRCVQLQVQLEMTKRELESIKNSFLNESSKEVKKV